MPFHINAVTCKKTFLCFTLFFLMAGNALAKAEEGVKDSLPVGMQQKSQGLSIDATKKPLSEDASPQKESTVSAQGPHALTAPIVVTTTNATLSRQKKAEKYVIPSQMTNSTLFPTANGTELFNRVPSNLPQMAPLSGWE